MYACISVFLYDLTEKLKYSWNIIIDSQGGEILIVDIFLYLVTSQR